MNGIVVLASVYGYRSAYPQLVDRMKLATSFSHDAGIAAVFGPTRSLETVAGFSAFRTLGVIPIIIGIWSALSATKAFRGNEDAGRWEILLSSPTTKRAATLATLRGLFATTTISLVISSGFLLIIARLSRDFSMRASLFFALTLVAAGYFFASLGAFTSQLTTTRRSASILAGLAIGISFLIRAIADSSVTYSWVHWLSPFGWITESAPLTHNRWLGLILLFSATAVFTIATVAISSQRDLGVGLFPDKSRGNNFVEVTSVFRLWLNLQFTNILSWIFGLFFMAFAFGLVAHAATRAFSGSSTIQSTFAKLGIKSGGNLFFGIIFLMLTTAVMFAANSFATAFRDQESKGYLDHLLVSPASRTKVFCARILVSVISLILISISTGLGVFTGSTIGHGALSFPDALLAGLNIVPSVLLLFGVSTLTFGAFPRATLLVGQSLLAWSFLLELIGSTLKLNHWLLDTSFLHHMAFAPASTPDWPKNALLTLISIGLIAIGMWQFMRRDIELGD
jgi:ABC-2 type transport system permease protein